MGVGAAMVEFSSWGWAFRSQHVKDYGIDAHTEPFDGLHQPSGRLLALQIKSGDSYFRDETDDGWWYWGENKHLRYWLGHVLPVLIMRHRFLLNEFAKISATRDAFLLFYDEFPLRGNGIGGGLFNGAQEFAFNKNALEKGLPVTKPNGQPNLAVTWPTRLSHFCTVDCTTWARGGALWVRATWISPRV